jgi:cation-transporting ATPase E
MALLLLTNRIRPEAPDTFRYFAQQGVAVKVISGDNPATVADVAARAAIENADKFVDAQTLETEEDFLQAVREYTVFGRVTPDKKKALILALKKQGHTVAMTGDGVNDVLAMRQADCGIGMAGGAQAATQVAQLVLTDGDFAGMPQIVAEGRRVINNIQRAAALFLVKNIFSLGLALLSLLTSWPYPLVPIQLTLISTLTIGVPSFFLAMEPNYERVTGSFIRGVLRKALPGGLTNIAVVMAAQAYRAAFGLTQEQTGTICAAILAAVGLLVLYQTCKPFDLFRRIIWGAMAVGLVGAFVFLGELFELHPGDEKVLLVMATLLAIAVSVFLVISRVFAWSDRMLEKLRQRRVEKSKQ